MYRYLSAGTPTWDDFAVMAERDVQLLYGEAYSDSLRACLAQVVQNAITQLGITDPAEAMRRWRDIPTEQLREWTFTSCPPPAIPSPSPSGATWDDFAAMAEREVKSFYGSGYSDKVRTCVAALVSDAITKLNVDPGEAIHRWQTLPPDQLETWILTACPPPPVLSSVGGGPAAAPPPAPPRAIGPGAGGLPSIGTGGGVLGLPPSIAGIPTMWLLIGVGLLLLMRR